jgi:hypothetical protein
MVRCFVSLFLLPLNLKLTLYIVVEMELHSPQGEVPWVVEMTALKAFNFLNTYVFSYTPSDM